LILLGRKAAELLNRVERTLARIEERIWSVEIAIGRQNKELHRMNHLLEHLVGDPVKVKELADQIERTADALEQATEENKLQEG
jgi:transcriptional regulator GlxA family with amidase domain